MDKKHSDSSEDNFDNNRQQGADSSTEIAGSPSSHSNSSSSNRQQRVVELLHVNEVGDEYQPRDWTIRPEFYDIDVAGNLDDDLSFDEEIEILDLPYNNRYGPPEDNEESAGEEEEDNVQSDYGEDDDDTDNDEPDYIIEPDYDDQSSTDQDEDSDETANYDTTRPVGHRYLGENLEESRGRQILVEGSTTNITLIHIIHVVLFPGQVLPITTSNLNPRIQACLKNCINSGLTVVGLLSDPYNNKIGTTAEIRNYSIESDELKLIMVGRQRFKLLSNPFEIAIEGVIKVLPEVTLGSPYSGISSPLLRFYTSSNVPNRLIISKFPGWVLKKYEARNVMLRILDQIKDWSSVDLTKDPNDFSYWMASNLPISNSDRIKALSFSCTEARLIWLLAMLEQSDVFGCSACKNVICYKKDAFPMSRAGPQCSFVNSGGFIHDTLTVRSARGLIQEYSWSKEFSWFPGYAWRLANCGCCHRHIGWCYKRIEPNIKPKVFFGLSRLSVRLQSGNLTPSINAEEGW